MKKKKQIQLDDDAEIDTDEVQKVIEEETQSGHYINNKEFFQNMVEWKKRVAEEKAFGKPTPPVTDYIGKCFLDIATHLSYRPNFINYPYKEEMISDGIENCLMYAANFDPSKSKNPFSYFTQIIYFAFLRRIAKEKKQMFIRYKMLEAADKNGKVRSNLLDRTESGSDDPLADYFHLSKNDIEKFSKNGKRRKKGKKRSKNNIDEL